MMRALAVLLAVFVGSADAEARIIRKAQTVARNADGIPERFFCLHHIGPLWLNPGEFGGNTYGIEWPYWNPSCMRLVLMARSGGTVFEWDQVETSAGVYNWVSVDETLTRMKAHGVSKVIFTVYAPPDFAMIGGPQERQITNITNIDGASALVTYSGGNYSFIQPGPSQITIHHASGANPNITGWTEATRYCVTARGTNTLTIKADGCTGAVTLTGGFSGTNYVEVRRGTPSQARTTAFVQAMIARIMSFGIGDIIVEVSNEAASTTFYRGSYSDLVLFHQYVYQAVKAAYPWLPVQLMAGNTIGRIGPPTVGNVGVYNNLFPDVAPWIDMTGTHHYPASSLGGEPNILQETLDVDEMLVSWRTKGVGHLPFVVSEWTTESTNSAVNRRYVMRLLIVHASRGVYTDAYYRWDANCCGATGGDSGWQLYDRPTFGPDAPGALNTLGVAYRNVKGWLEGARFLTKPDGVSTIQTADIINPRGVRSRIYYYSLNSGSTTTAAPAWVTRCEDIDGNVTPVTTVGQTLTITPEPIRCSSHVP